MWNVECSKYERLYFPREASDMVGDLLCECCLSTMQEANGQRSAVDHRYVDMPQVERVNKMK